MIVWTGRGILSVLILLIVLYPSLLLFPSNADYGIVCALFITAIFSWLFGKKWNCEEAKIYMDTNTGQRVSFRRNHTLFWIPMQYWGIIYSVVAIIILFQNSLLIASIALGILITFMVFQIVRKNSNPENRKLEFKSSRQRRKEEQEEEERLRLEAKKKEEEKLRRRKEKEDPSRFMPS